MNWVALGALGEIVGAAAVVITLGYLAIQLRANTKALRLESEREAFDGVRILLAQLSGDADLARIFRTGLAGMESLDPDEAMRFGTYLLSTTYQWLRVHTLERDGILEKDLIEASTRVRRDTVATPGYREWFELRKHWLPDDFRDRIEHEIAAESTGYVPYGTESQ